MSIRIREGGIVGTFGAPEGERPFPGVLALGGSDGGTPEYFLNLLVREGFACLALQYWGTTETQLSLSHVPVERIEQGLRWLAQRPDVETIRGSVGVVGASRGGELALIVAATFPELVGPVVAYTPSSVAWMGLDFTLPPGTTRSSWALRGEPLPYVCFPAGVAPSQSERGYSMLPICERGLEDLESVQRATIHVEHATGPILLVSGGDDKVWATGRMCEMVVNRMAQHGRAGDVRHLHYARAGHMLFPYVRPSDVMVPAMPFDLGGTAEADGAAHADAWPQVTSHLRQAGATR